VPAHEVMWGGMPRNKHWVSVDDSQCESGEAGKDDRARREYEAYAGGIFETDKKETPYETPRETVPTACSGRVQRCRALGGPLAASKCFAGLRPDWNCRDEPDTQESQVRILNREANS
jgi:hypothetical protein